MDQDIKIYFNNINAYLLVDSVNISKHPTSFVIDDTEIFP
jgi:hypothetical protein